jgi:hypothetical protein
MKPEFVVAIIKLIAIFIFASGLSHTAETVVSLLPVAMARGQVPAAIWISYFWPMVGVILKVLTPAILWFCAPTLAHQIARTPPSELRRETSDNFVGMLHVSLIVLAITYIPAVLVTAVRLLLGFSMFDATSLIANLVFVLCLLIFAGKLSRLLFNPGSKGDG